MGQLANCEYVCNAINKKMGTNFTPVAGTAGQAANCKYLLTMIDKANGGSTSYGTGNFATLQAVDDIAVNKAVNDLCLLYPLLDITKYDYAIDEYECVTEGYIEADLTGGGGEGGWNYPNNGVPGEQTLVRIVEGPNSTFTIKTTPNPQFTVITKDAMAVLGGSGGASAPLIPILNGAQPGRNGNTEKYLYKVPGDLTAGWSSHSNRYCEVGDKILLKVGRGGGTNPPIGDANTFGNGGNPRSPGIGGRIKLWSSTVRLKPLFSTITRTRNFSVLTGGDTVITAGSPVPPVGVVVNIRMCGKGCGQEGGHSHSLISSTRGTIFSNIVATGSILAFNPVTRQANETLTVRSFAFEGTITVWWDEKISL